jgi:D-alanyl-D-alanine carboxypeptidase
MRNNIPLPFGVPDNIPLPFDVLSAFRQSAFTDGFLPEDLASVDSSIINFMRQYSVPGMSLAIARLNPVSEQHPIPSGGSLVYAKGFGFAEKTGPGFFWEPVDVWSRFRIASATKPITSVAIFTLIEQGLLSLQSKVFGADGVLGTNFGFDSLPPEQSDKLAQITVQNLLEHTAGGWPNDSTDPMFIHPEWSQQQLITWVLRNRPLDNPPGSIWAYSNFGYCLLGRIIEQVSGQAYANFVQDKVLTPRGITTMEIAGDTLAERRPGEVVYYGQSYLGYVGTPPKGFPVWVPDDPYGFPVSRMDSHGGWIASAVDLVRFASGIERNFLLTLSSLRTMTTDTTAKTNGQDPQDPFYAKGWVLDHEKNRWSHVDDFPGWYHVGDLPGTLSILYRSKSPFCWAALVNTWQAWNMNNMSYDLYDTLWKIFGKNGQPGLVTQWPQHDLFPFYDDPTSIPFP